MRWSATGRTRTTGSCSKKLGREILGGNVLRTSQSDGAQGAGAYLEDELQTLSSLDELLSTVSSAVS